MGVRTVLEILRTHGDLFHNFIFIEVGVVNVNAIKEESALKDIEKSLNETLDAYVSLMRRHGFSASCVWGIGTDVVKEVMELAQGIMADHPDAVFFGGRLVFDKESILTRIFHNYHLMSLQEKLFQCGVQFTMVPVYLPSHEKRRK